MSHRVIIADDEPLARQRVRMMLSGHAGYTIVAECEDGPDVVEAIIARRPDVVFLDIEMPGLDGFEVLAALDHRARPPVVIFVTAHAAHALQAFEVGVVDYLLKPFDEDRFSTALARAQGRLASRTGAAVDPASRGFLEGLQTRGAYPERFLVRAAKHLYFVRSAEIEWAEGASNYVRLHIGGHTHLVRDTLKGVVAKLPPDRFVRIHRSVLVNLDRVVRLEPKGHGEYLITMRDGTRLSSSRTHGERLHALLR